MGYMNLKTSLLTGLNLLLTAGLLYVAPVWAVAFGLTAGILIGLNSGMKEPSNG